MLLGAWAVACSSAAFDGQVYRNDEVAFRVGPVPGNWRRIQTEGALLAFRDDSRGATVAVNARCGKDGDDVPLESLTHHLFLHFTDRRVVSQERSMLDGREALKTELSAKLDGVPKHFSVLVLKKDGCVYDFLEIRDTESGEDFDRFVRGFGTVS